MMSTRGKGTQCERFLQPIPCPETHLWIWRVRRYVEICGEAGWPASKVESTRRRALKGVDGLRGERSRDFRNIGKREGRP